MARHHPRQRRYSRVPCMVLRSYLTLLYFASSLLQLRPKYWHLPSPRFLPSNLKINLYAPPAHPSVPFFLFKAEALSHLYFFPGLPAVCLICTPALCHSSPATSSHFDAIDVAFNLRSSVSNVSQPVSTIFLHLAILIKVTKGMGGGDGYGRGDCHGAWDIGIH